VTTLDNYLACSVETRAEIVVLIRRGEQILGQIDIDSDIPNAFTAVDEALLNRIADVLADTLGWTYHGLTPAASISASSSV
jgi:GAF domain-containing protein